MTTVTLRVRGFASSTLDGVAEMAEMAEELGHDEAAGLRLLANAYRDNSLTFDATHADAIADALQDLANGEDAYAENPQAKRTDPEGVRIARAASNGLAGLASKARQSMARRNPARLGRHTTADDVMRLVRIALATTDRVDRQRAFAAARRAADATGDDAVIIAAYRTLRRAESA